MGVNGLMGRAERAVPALLALGAAASLLAGITGWTAAARMGSWIGFGLAAGYAAARAMGPVEPEVLFLSRLVYLAPLLAGGAVVALLAAGLDAGAAGAWVLGAAYATALPAAARPRRRIRPATPWERRLAVWLAVLGAIVILPHLFRPWVRMRSDAWFHTSIALEIMARGAPPGDPYFAGIPLNYMWFYHALLAAWARAARVMPWDLGGTLNALWLVSLGGAAYALSRRAARPAREAFFAAVFVPLGLSALFWAWFPVKLLRTLFGATSGAEEVRRAFAATPFGFDQIFHFTSLWGSPPPFLNKYLVMTVLGGAVTGAVWLAEGLTGTAQDARGRGPRAALRIAAAALGVWLWHPGVAVPVMAGVALAGLWLLLRPGPVPRRAALSGALGVAVGSAAAAPLLLVTVSRAQGPFPLGAPPVLPAILVGSTAAMLLGLPALARSRGGPGLRVYRALAAGYAVGAVLTRLPPPNTKDKMPFVFYLLLAGAAGWMVARLLRWFRARGRGKTGWALLLALLLPVNLLYLAVYLFEPASPGPSPAAHALYDWLAAGTPADAVILDSPERDDVLVRVPRRQFWGREPYALQWEYDPAVMNARRVVRDVLEGAPGPQRTAIWPAPDAGEVGPALATLAGFARSGTGPLYVLWRPDDHGGAPAEESVMAAHPERFRMVWSNSEASVYRYTP